MLTNIKYRECTAGQPGPSDDGDGDAVAQFFLSGFFPSSQG